jgi:adenosylmethionine-8-amino-7-oxononanoate aminotransferase
MAAAQRFFVARGVWIRPFGRLLYLMPPYVIEPSDLAQLTAAVCAWCEARP